MNDARADLLSLKALSPDVFKGVELLPDRTVSPSERGFSIAFSCKKWHKLVNMLENYIARSDRMNIALLDM